MKNKAVAIYRMPNESDFFSLVSKNKLELNSTEESGFFFSEFESGIIYSLKNPQVLKNNWPYFNWEFNHSDKEISYDDYLPKIRQITDKIKNGQFKKVVFSRIKNIDKHPDFSIEKTFMDLCKTYPKAFIYCVSSKEIGTWIGATPELLLNKEEGFYQTVSLAGTRVNGVEWTKKEKQEQQVVTDYILSKISSFSDSIKVSNPFDLDTGSVIHLKSDIEFQLKEKNAIWDLVNILHPTPAVCGIPSIKAKQFIQEIELQKRNLYTGFIGPMGINNHNSLFVNLRCMQICRNEISLYLGGGIMADSNPENEWIETESKSKTLLKVL